MMTYVLKKLLLKCNKQYFSLNFKAYKNVGDNS